MKKTQINIFVLLLSVSVMSAQSLNWNTLVSGQRHIISLFGGYEYGMNYGLSYSHVIRQSQTPALAEASMALPMGDKLLDDFKTTLGLRSKFLSSGKWMLSGGAHIIARRNSQTYVTLFNMGWDASVMAGYYRQSWFIGIEGIFDKAMATHFHHSEIYRSILPDAADGWYGPSTGGNFSTAIVGGVNMGIHYVSMRIGRTVAQDFKSQPVMPFFGMLNYGVRF